MDNNGRRLLLIVNPRAGTMQSQRGFFAVNDYFCRQGFSLSVHVTQGKGDATRVARQRGADFDVVACAGGDGTLNEVIRGIMELSPRPLLGYLPCGSTNDFASTLKLPKNMLKSAEIIARGNAMDIDVGSFCGRPFAYVASFGAFSDASFSAPQKTKNALGHAAYILEGLADLPSIRPRRIVLRADGRELEEEVLFGCVSNTMSMGGILKFDKLNISLNDGLFEVILIKRLKNAAQLQRVVSCLQRQKFDCEEIIYLTAAHIELDMPPDTPWSLDGEFQEGVGHADIDNLHSAIKLLR